MTTEPAFLVECYWPGVTAEQFAARRLDLTAHLAAHQAALLHSMYLPADEAVQWVVTASDRDRVAAACESAGIAYQRLVPVLADT